MRSRYRAFIFMICGLICCHAQPAHILVIESYHAQYPWDMGYKKALQEHIAGEHQFSFFEMDTKRVTRAQYLYRAELAWTHYQDLKPDIVVLGDDNALKYLGGRLAQTLTPVVYLGINNNPRNYGIANADNITGVLERPLIKRSIMTAAAIAKDMKRVLILFDSGNTAQIALANEFANQKTSTVSNIQVETKLIGNYALWKNQVLSAKSKDFDAIIIGLYHTLRDEKDQHIAAEQVLSWTSKNTSLPLFGLWDFAIGQNKACGGLVLQSYQQGAAAANIINRILQGESPQQIRPTTATNGTYLFSRSEIERFRLLVPEQIALSAKWID